MAAVRTIGLSLPWLDEREEELVADVLRSGRLSLGPTIDRFEEAFAERVGAPYAAAVSSTVFPRMAGSERLPADPRTGLGHSLP